MEATIIVAAIAALASVIVAVINNFSNKKTNQKIDENKKESDLNAIRTQILLLIGEDKDNIRDGKLPENRKDIEELYDLYTSKGGNSYIKRKVTYYFDLVDSLEIKEENK